MMIIQTFKEDNLSIALTKSPAVDSGSSPDDGQPTCKTGRFSMRKKT